MVDTNAGVASAPDICDSRQREAMEVVTDSARMSNATEGRGGSRARMPSSVFACTVAAIAAVIALPALARAESQVSLSPASGPAGTTATIDGAGFGADHPVTVAAGRTSLARTRTNARGSFEASFAVPARTATTLKITSRSGRTRVVNLFRVSSLPGARLTNEAALRHGARLRWTPGTDVAWRTIELRGYRFPRRRKVRIALDQKTVETTRSNRRGRFSARIAVSSLSNGRHRVQARAGSTALGFEFDLTSAGVEPPHAGPGLSPVAGSDQPALPPVSPPPPPPGPPPQPKFPIRAAFYYPWFPETWTVNGAHVFYNPVLGYYGSGDQAVIDQHIRWLDYAKVNVAIASWWGPSTHNEQSRIPALLARTAALGSALKWAAYYEKEGYSNPTVAELQADLGFLAGYASSPFWARVNGKPVIFVYNTNDTTCEVADRWKQAAPDWYVVLKVFSGYRSCPNQPDSWHQYAPTSPEDHQAGYSIAISPGFWRADETAPRLARDTARWQQNVQDMVASGEPWQLITTFDEWGEGTAVEPASEWSSPSGKGSYLDALAGL